MRFWVRRWLKTRTFRSTWWPCAGCGRRGRWKNYTQCRAAGPLFYCDERCTPVVDQERHARALRAALSELRAGRLDPAGLGE